MVGARGLVTVHCRCACDHTYPFWQISISHPTSVGDGRTICGLGTDSVSFGTSKLLLEWKYYFHNWMHPVCKIRRYNLNCCILVSIESKFHFIRGLSSFINWSWKFWVTRKPKPFVFITTGRQSPFTRNSLPLIQQGLRNYLE